VEGLSRAPIRLGSGSGAAWNRSLQQKLSARNGARAHLLPFQLTVTVWAGLSSRACISLPRCSSCLCCSKRVMPHGLYTDSIVGMEQVISNLLTNAIKYSPQGGPIVVTVGKESTDHAVEIQVQDGGIGIPLHQQARIFGRFMRADNAQAAGISGTGLGLYLCRALVEQHAGRIWFTSAEGKGTTFSFSLPLSSDLSTPSGELILSASSAEEAETLQAEGETFRGA
jgi:signal transduction histidine kinase